MLEILEELNAARDALYSALDRYVSACSAIRNCCVSRSSSNGVHQLENLSDCAVNELLLFTSYKARLKQAKAAMSVARNFSPALVPINHLPPEILSRIFHLVLDAQDCIGKVVLAPAKTFTLSGPKLPEYPDLLSLVCYHWQQTAMGSNTLWSHIDIVPHEYFSEIMLIRAQAYAARAGQSLLDIHVVDKSVYQGSHNAAVIQFLQSIARRIRSLDLIAFDVSAPIHHSILRSCFSHCVPGTFTRLHIKQNMFGDASFIEATEHLHSPEGLVLDIPQETFDDIMLPVSSLRLSGLYPYWTSAAYRGLTVLHLFPWGTFNTKHITESQLVNILVSSPRLRVLFFNLEITEPLPIGASVTPVHLDDLEVLNVQFMSVSQLEVFLRWLNLGSYPLQLAFRLPSASNMSILSQTSGVRRFFERSNVSKLYLIGMEASLIEVGDLLPLTPHLQVLALDGFSCTRNPTPGANIVDRIAQLSHLNHLYMLKCLLDPEFLRIFRQILEKYPVQRLTLWDCSYFHDRKSYADEQALINNISSIFPTTQFINRDEPSPIDNWEVMA